MTGGDGGSVSFGQDRLYLPFGRRRALQDVVRPLQDKKVEKRGVFAEIDSLGKEIIALFF